jgi:hypothetical protein
LDVHEKGGKAMYECCVRCVEFHRSMVFKLFRKKNMPTTCVMKHYYFLAKAVMRQSKKQQRTYASSEFNKESICRFLMQPVQ